MFMASFTILHRRRTHWLAAALEKLHWQEISAVIRNLLGGHEPIQPRCWGELEEGVCRYFCVWGGLAAVTLPRHIPGHRCLRGLGQRLSSYTPCARSLSICA
jgi:hypothetical protein